MAKEEFKNEITQRFILLVNSLKKRGFKNNTQIAELIGQPLQVISKLLSGERIITLEQVGELCKNGKVNSEWLLTGNEPMFRDDVQIIDSEQKSNPKDEPAGSRLEDQSFPVHFHHLQ